MSIRLKIAIILIVAVVVPLAISSYFWFSAMRDTLGSDLTVKTLVLGDMEKVIATRAARGLNRRSENVTKMLATAVKRLDRDLEDVGCVGTAQAGSAACERAVKDFFEFYRGDIDGLRVSSAGRNPSVRESPPAPPSSAFEGDVPEPPRSTVSLKDITDSLGALEAEPGPVRMSPLKTKSGLAFVTSRRLADGQRVTAWGTFAQLRSDLEQLGSGRSARLGLVGARLELLRPLRFESQQGAVTTVADGPALAGWLKAGTQGVVEIDDHRYIGRYAQVPGTRVGTLILTSLDDFAQVRLVKALGLQIALMVGALIAAIVLTDRMMRRLRRLRDAADELGSGNLQADIQVSGRDEIGRLAERFRVMAGQLREHITTLEQKVDERTRDLRLKAEELERANDDLVRLTKLKSDFLARMSHELRTPLNSIIGFSELLLAEGCGPINEEQKDGLERVMRNGKNLLQLINDILDISKIEADRLTLKFGPAQLRTIVDNAISTLMLRATEKKIALNAVVDPDLPMLVTDEVRLLQILNNLLSNAVKFTEKGGVTLTAKRQDTGVVITVQDTGIGIAAEDVPKLFTEFYQTHSGRDRKYEGTGLGLAITRRLAEALGGTATVTSELGVGSTFTVTLPITAPGAETETAPVASPRAQPDAAARPLDRPPTILVVDDDPATHVLMAENLKPIGARMLTAATGAAGLDVARRERPDLILLDVRLPDRQGWEVLHDLKADPDTLDIPVIIVSVVDRESLGLSLGAADYIVKPVNWDQMHKVLGRLGIAPGGDVLVVDDDPEQRALLRRSLESRGFAVREAPDGVQALEAARERRPGLILLDLMMPVMDGFDALAHLRADPKTARVPVVVLTAKDLTETDRARLSGNVDALFQKQRVPLDQLVGEVRSLLWKGSHA